jgi:hypothetical protein
MKSFFKTLTFSLVTASSLTLYISPQSLAVTSSANNIPIVTNQKISHLQNLNPEQKLSHEVAETLIAAGCGYQRMRGVLFYCCVDSWGNWACEPV